MSLLVLMLIVSNHLSIIVATRSCCEDQLKQQLIKSSILPITHNKRMNTSVKSLAAAVGFVARSVTGTSRFAAYQRNSPTSCIGHQRLQQQLQTNNFSSGAPTWHGTTILCVRKGDKVCLMGDGQVSMGSVVVKPNTRKIRRILPKNSASNIRGAPSEETNPQGTLVGFAGSTADAFTLLERLEGKLDEYPGQLTRSCVELAKGWRTDKYLRRLEASIIVADKNVTLELTGNGDVLESHDGVIAVGSGGHFALGKKICFDNNFMYALIFYFIIIELCNNIFFL